MNDKISNKEEYLKLVDSIARGGIDRLKEFIVNSDFFDAPASSVYHSNVEGGLCEHSLNVYYNMKKLCEVFEIGIPEDSIKITALFHDLAKIGFYKVDVRNKKEYTPNGSKHDELGYFDWVSVKGYRVKDPAERDLICGEHGFNSYYIVNRFIKLTEAETAAILNHHLGLDNNFAFKDMNEALNRYPTLLLLHLADMGSTYIQENPYLTNE